MDLSELALEVVEIISHLKEELGKAHNRIVMLEEQLAEKERCIQELTDNLMLRVINSQMQKSAQQVESPERPLSCARDDRSGERDLQSMLDDCDREFSDRSDKPA